MSNDFQAGARLGNYVLESYVGGGSFGAVWRGRDTRDDKDVAIKLLTGALAASEAAATRADIEMLAAAAASRSQHVVKVLDGGSDPVPYIVMEFIEGEDLLTTLKRGALGAAKTVEVGLAISDALQALYQAGIVHRDIKPANVMTDKAGVIKLADFGIAKIVGYETITMAGQAAMTMAYAAPEIWDESGPFGKPSHKSDLYAMGILLYQCLTGVTPFRGTYGTLYKAHTEETPDLHALPGDTPPSLRNLIGRCLQKHQEDRPNDADECRTILRRAEAEVASTTGAATVTEPRKLGPWIKDAPHDSVAWAWRCHHETTGQRATVEVHFTGQLSYSETLRKAVSANPQLKPFGAEGLIEANRLLLRPTESWWEPPPGEFQFWVAREDLELTAQAAPLNTAGLRRTVQSLIGLLHASNTVGIRLDLRAENVTLLESGGVYVRRPGLVEPLQDASAAAFAYLRGLTLAPDARMLMGEATSLADLAERLAEDDDPATLIASQATLIGRPDDEDSATVVRPQVARQAARAPVDAPVRRVTRLQPEEPGASKQKPFVLIGVGAVAVIAVIAGLLFLAFGSGSGKKDDRAGVVSKAEIPAVATAEPTAVATPPAGSKGQERVVNQKFNETTYSDCTDGKGSCRLDYVIGPFRFRDNTLRIEYTVQITVPRPGTGVEWIDDVTFAKQQAAKGEAGTQLVGASGRTWPLISAGGIAARSDPALVSGSYFGYWEFVFDEAVGTDIKFDYVDFDHHITVQIPK